MGGGGGSYSHIPRKSKEERQKAFKSAEGEVRDSKIRNVFISFHIPDEPQVRLLRHQAKDNQYGLRFRDYSSKEPFEITVWKEEVQKRIKQSSAFIVMIGEATWTRTAVIWEIKQAYAMGKNVIAVRISSNREDYIPQLLVQNDAPVVDWNLAKISKLIEE